MAASLNQTGNNFPTSSSDKIAHDAMLPDSPVGQVAETGVRLSQQPVRPTFDDRQPPAVTDAILEDGQEHAIVALFHDASVVRARKKPGTNSQANSFIPEAARAEEKGQLQALLTKFDVSVSPAYLSAVDKTDLELDTEKSSLHARSGIELPNQGSWISFHLNKWDKKSARDLVGALNGLPFVRSAEVVPDPHPTAADYVTPPVTEPKFPKSSGVANWRDHCFDNTQTFNDGVDQSSTGIEWYWFNRHSVGGAWQYSRGEGTQVAVIDRKFVTDAALNDGVVWDTDHQRRYYTVGGVIASDTNVAPDPNIDISYPDNFDMYHHGTFIANMIGASDTNGFGLCGVAPSAKVTPIAAMSKLEVINAIDYASTMGIPVISLSLGIGAATGNNPENDQQYRDAFSRAWARGTTVVYSVGNNGQLVTVNSSSNFTGAIFVGGITKYDVPDPQSNYGSRVDIAAADDNVSQTFDTGVDSAGHYIKGSRTVRKDSGTSFATPMVAAAAAMVRRWTSSPAATRDIVMFTADLTGASSNGVYDAARQMSGGFNGQSETWSKVRVLNCESAARVAMTYHYYPSDYIIYRPASDDYTQIKWADGTNNNGAWEPANLMQHYASANIQCWTYRQSGPWAASTNVFKNGTRYWYDISGTPRLYDAYGNVKASCWTSTHALRSVA